MPSASPETDRPVSADALQAYVHDHTDAYLQFLDRLVRAESPSTDPETQARVQRVLAEAFADLGFAATHLPGTNTGGSVYARPAARSQGAPCQLLLGHSDTVWPAGTLDTMPAERDGNELRGPGVFDMKAGLANIVFALRALDALGSTPAVCPLVLVTSDEEIGSPESRRHIERLAEAAERVFVLEPALGLEGRIKTARKGTGEMTLLVRPTDPAPEGNVVLELSRLVQRLYDLQDPGRGVTINVGTIDGQHGGGPNGAARGRLVADVRVPTHDDAARLRAAIRSLEADTPGVRVEVRGGIERPPLERTAANRRLWQMAQERGAWLGLPLEEGRAGGASDGNFTSQHTATLDGLGAVGDGAHADHEHIRIEETLDRCALLALLLAAPPLAQNGPA
jgi:glutamate carboxypeptidase